MDNSKPYTEFSIARVRYPISHTLVAPCCRKKLIQSLRMARFSSLVIAILLCVYLRQFLIAAYHCGIIATVRLCPVDSGVIQITAGCQRHSQCQDNQYNSLVHVISFVAHSVSQCIICAIANSLQNVLLCSTNVCSMHKCSKAGEDYRTRVLEKTIAPFPAFIFPEIPPFLRFWLYQWRLGTIQTPLRLIEPLLRPVP